MGGAYIRDFTVCTITLLRFPLLGPDLTRIFTSNEFYVRQIFTEKSFYFVFGMCRVVIMFLSGLYKFQVM